VVWFGELTSGVARAARSGLVARYIPSCKRATSACLLQPEETEGPYYWDSSVRSNITYVRSTLWFFHSCAPQLTVLCRVVSCV
jgi:hypothetical protein